MTIQSELLSTCLRDSLTSDLQLQLLGLHFLWDIFQTLGLQYFWDGGSTLQADNYASQANMFHLRPTTLPPQDYNDRQRWL